MSEPRGVRISIHGQVEDGELRQLATAEIGHPADVEPFFKAFEQALLSIRLESAGEPAQQQPAVDTPPARPLPSIDPDDDSWRRA